MTSEIIRRDIERRIVDRHKQWITDSLELCAMADLDFKDAVRIISSELVYRAITALDGLGYSPEKSGELVAATLVEFRKQETSHD